jgi:hypothetical protein
VWNERIRTRIGAIFAAQRTPDEAMVYESVKLRLSAMRVLERRGTSFEECLPAAVNFLAGDRLNEIVM